MINTKVHRFLDCHDFPAGVNIKVKSKMTTTNIRHVTCDHCKRRIMGEFTNEVDVERDWETLTPAEARLFENSATEVDELIAKKKAQ